MRSGPGIEPRQEVSGHEGWRPALSPSQRDGLIRRIELCRQELRDLQEYRTLTFDQYQTDRSARRNVERIAETVANAVIGMAKTLVGASVAPVPQGYAAALRTLGQLGLVPRELADRLAALAELRHEVEHEYLQPDWALLEQFIQSGGQDVLELVTLVERLVMPSQPEEAGAGPATAPAPQTGEG